MIFLYIEIFWGYLMNKKIFDYSYTLKKEKQHRDVMLLIYIIGAVAFISILFSLIIFPVRLNTNSMSSQIKKQSVVMVTPLVKTPGRGDVVLLKAPAPIKTSIFRKVASSVTMFFTAQQISLMEDENIAGSCEHLRRVIGVPGDTVYISDFVAHVKPKNDKHFLTEFEFADRTYNLNIKPLPEGWDSSNGFSDSFKEITLGEDEYFVLCDNRNVYDDSRIWGPIKQDEIKGKALFCYFPFRSFKFY